MPIELLRVQKKGGKVHLCAVLPEDGKVDTLCGQSFAVGDLRQVGAETDCQPCLRRQANPAFVSTYLFSSGLGASLLEMSLAQVGERRRAATPPRAAAKAVEAGASAPPARVQHPPPPPPSPPVPEVLGELTLAGLKKAGADVYRSPAGVLIRLRKVGADWQVAEVVFDGSVLVRRKADGRIQLQVGDVRIEYTAEGFSLSAVYALE